MCAVECQEEHDPSGWVTGLLGVIADMAADGRRGVAIEDGATFQVSANDDSGSRVVLTLTVHYEF